ncbi:MAG: DUF962 domain-containing protein [Alteromonadaceae bacterium]|nr:DUF962 domain-containing protein [Alteromonadaceae bacterium]
MSDKQTFKNYREFYHFYLTEHSNPTCRNLHYIGSALVLTVLFYGVFSAQYSILWSLPIIGYGFAWIGHFFFEHNKPATFKRPFWSFASDWVMFFQFITGTLSNEHFKSDNCRG